MERLTLVFLSLCALAFTAPPNKPVWPKQFEAAFGLSVPAVPNTNPAIINRASYFYYDWDIQSSLIDYPNGCLPGLFQDSYKFPCKIYFNTKGAFLSIPSLSKCCLLFPGVGSIPPNFLAGFNYSGYDSIAFDYSGTPYFTHFWVAEDGFQYWTDATDQFGRDIQFQDGGLVLWSWAPLNATAQDPSRFNLPNAQCSNQCAADMKIVDPMVRLAAHHYKKL